MQDQRPNILLITTDQHRGDCLGIEGHPVLQTPYLDWIGASGVHARHAYSACPVCVPARRTLLTGRKPVNHGLLMNGKAPLDYPTIATELAKVGYQTHLVGKGHFGPPPSELGFGSSQWADSPRPKGDTAYQRFLHDNGITGPRAADAHGAPHNGWIVRSWHLEERFHFSNWCADEAVRFLQERDRNRPFFLMVNFLHPHQPLTPPQFYYDRYMQMELPPPVVGDWARVFANPVRGLAPQPWRVELDPIVMKQYRAAYYGSINHIDDQIGRFATYEMIPEDDTAVLFTADHGEMLGDHQWLRKRNAFEASARVPLLLKLPPALGIRQERSLDPVVELMDVMPTLLDVGGAPVPAGVDGASLLPLLRDEVQPGDGWREYVHGECAEVPSSGSGMQYVTDGRQKYIWWPSLGQEQFFDLEADPLEMHDLIAEDRAPAAVSEWRQRLVAELVDRDEGFTDGVRLLTLPRKDC
jgi:arylsulfatase